jgi:hypothetical protein
MSEAGAVTIKDDKDQVLVVNGAGRTASMPWSTAVEFGQAIAWKAREPRWPGDREIIAGLMVSREHDHILVVEPTGETFLWMPLDAAREVGHAIAHKGHVVEERDKYEQVIYDQAILARQGINVGIGHQRGIREEAAKEAAWNTDLRRYIRSSQKLLQAVVYPMTVRKGTIDAADRLRARLLGREPRGGSGSREADDGGAGESSE